MGLPLLGLRLTLVSLCALALRRLHLLPLLGLSLSLDLTLLSLRLTLLGLRLPLLGLRTLPLH